MKSCENGESVDDYGDGRMAVSDFCRVFFFSVLTVGDQEVGVANEVQVLPCQAQVFFFITFRIENGVEFNVGGVHDCFAGCTNTISDRAAGMTNLLLPVDGD